MAPKLRWRKEKMPLSSLYIHGLYFESKRVVADFAKCSWAASYSLQFSQRTVLRGRLRSRKAYITKLGTVTRCRTQRKFYLPMIPQSLCTRNDTPIPSGLGSQEFDFPWLFCSDQLRARPSFSEVCASSIETCWSYDIRHRRVNQRTGHLNNVISIRHYLSIIDIRILSSGQ